MMFYDQSALASALEAKARLQRSPLTAGLLAGGKAALIAAPLGAAIQAIRDKSPLGGGLVAGLGSGAVSGLAAAIMQKYRNLRTEGELRYHFDNIADRDRYAGDSPVVLQYREPLPSQSPGFSQGFNDVYNTF